MMAIKEDPEKYEIGALLDLANFSEQKVLEIGCGDGRLTRRYAGLTAQVTAIDPYAEGIERGRRNLPEELRGHVEFLNISFEEYADNSESAAFDIVILSWALC